MFRGPGPATVRQTAMMRERAGAGNAVINTWPQSRILNSFPLSDSLLLCQFVSLNPNHFPSQFVPLSLPLCLTHTQTYGSLFPPLHTNIHRARQNLAQQAEWNHPHMQPADTYMCSHSDTSSYTPVFIPGSC